MSEPERDGQWWVLVEETEGSYRGRRLVPLRPAEDREDALRLAEDAARTYEPRHPAMPQRRSVFRTMNDSWVVLVEGATSTFHFTVTAAKGEWSSPA
jgi:hypothetical protein